MTNNTEARALIGTIRGQLGSLDAVLAESPDFDAGTLGALSAGLRSIETALTTMVEKASREYDPMAGG